MFFLTTNIIYSVLIFTYRVGDDISHDNKFDGKAILELISSLYEEEDDMIVSAEGVASDENIRHLKNQTTQGLINGADGCIVRENNEFPCPFCPDYLKICSYADLIVHAHDIARDHEKKEANVVHRVLVEYLMWSRDLVKFREEIGIHM